MPSWVFPSFFSSLFRFSIVFEWVLEGFWKDFLKIFVIFVEKADFVKYCKI